MMINLSVCVFETFLQSSDSFLFNCKPLMKKGWMYRQGKTNIKCLSIDCTSLWNCNRVMKTIFPKGIPLVGVLIMVQSDMTRQNLPSVVSFILHKPFSEHSCPVDGGGITRDHAHQDETFHPRLKVMSKKKFVLICSDS